MAIAGGSGGVCSPICAGEQCFKHRVRIEASRPGLSFFDDVSTEPSDSEARAEELEQQEELAALSGSGSDSPFGSVHDLEIDDEDF